MQNGRKAAAHLLQDCQGFGDRFAVHAGHVSRLVLDNAGRASGIVMEDGVKCASQPHMTEQDHDQCMFVALLTNVQMVH